LGEEQYPSLSPPVAKTPASDPQHPDYYKHNLADMASFDLRRRSAAVQRLANEDPSKVEDAEVRNGIARAMGEAAFDTMTPFSTRAEAVEGLVTWGSTYSVPLLLELLEDNVLPVRKAVYQALAKLEDERAIEPVARRFAGEIFSRDDAAECLKAFGAKAEDAVLQYAKPNDPTLTKATVNLLAEIGTKKSLGPLKSLSELTFYPVIQDDVDRAVQAIEARSRGSETRGE
jgi:HEAT repeat protein